MPPSLQAHIVISITKNCSEAEFLDKDLPVRIVVGITCVLSALGALTIIASYALFRKLRSRPRLILVHISLMDCLVSVANFAGDVANFDQYYLNANYTASICSPPSENLTRPAMVAAQFYQQPSLTIDTLCQVQGTIALYATICSVLWTISLAVYLYFYIINYRYRTALYSYVFSYGFCYGMPAIVVGWLVYTKRVGYSPYNSSGWCALKVYDPASGETNNFVAIVGYDLWIYTAMIVVTVCFLGLRGFLATEAHTARRYVPEQKFWQAAQLLDYKFMMIPVVFVLLRIWSCIINILFYANVDLNSIPAGVTLTLIYLSGIGDSGQGIANVILFVFLTPPVRKRLLQVVLFRRPVVEQPTPGSINKRHPPRNAFPPPRYRTSPWPDEKTPFMSTPENSSYCYKE